METRRVRGALLISFLLLIKVLLMLVVGMLFRLRGSSFANRGAGSDHLALLGAETGLARALSHLAESAAWSTD